MPVRKFRTLDEAARSLWRDPGDPRIWDGVVRRWQLHRFLARAPLRRRAPGVFKYASIDEKQRRQSSSFQGSSS
jgi:hypothetical protein